MPPRFGGGDEVLAATERLAHLVAEGQKNLEERARRNSELLDGGTDAATGLSNRRGLEQALATAQGLKKRYQQPFSLIVLTVAQATLPTDGSRVGLDPVVIQAVAQSILEEVRDTDVAARHRPDGFALVLPHTELAQTAAVICARLERALAATLQDLGQFSIRLGAASPVADEEPTALLAQAEEALTRRGLDTTQRTELCQSGAWHDSGRTQGPGTQARVQHLEQSEAKLRSYTQELERLADAHALAIEATRDVAVFALAKLADSRDPETGEHLTRIRDYAQTLGRRLSVEGPYTSEVDGEFLETLYRSSPLHDIGKVGISDAILLKPGRLTTDEFEAMKRHAAIGQKRSAKLAARVKTAGSSPWPPKSRTTTTNDGTAVGTLRG